MEAMTDVIFYKNKISHETILEGYKNIINIPNVDDELIIDGNVYAVSRRVFDFDKNTVHIILNSLKKKFR